MARIELASDLTINLPRAGDTGDGTPNNPYNSIQRALDDLMANYDLRGFGVTLKLQAGILGSANPYIFYKGFCFSGRIPGQSGLGIPLLNMPGEPPFVIGRKGRLSIVGSENPAHPHGAFIFPMNGEAACVSISEGAAIAMSGVGMDSSRVRQDCVDVFDGAFLDIHDVVFGNAGAAFSNHISAAFGAKVQISGHVMVSGYGASFATIGNNSCLYWNNNGEAGLTIPFTLTNTPYFRDAFMQVDNGMAYIHAVAFSGAATGKRWSVMRNGVVSTNSPDPNYLPGNSAGSAQSGGQYV